MDSHTVFETMDKILGDENYRVVKKTCRKLSLCLTKYAMET